MTYKLIPYSNLTKIQNDAFFEFLEDASKEVAQPAHENMWSDDWVNKPNTLPYLLEKTNRFGKGGNYNIMFDGDKVISCSGIYTSEFCAELAIAGTRTWVGKEYRNLSIPREFLLPAEKSWAIENKFKAIAVCFNDYNKNIIKLWKRLRLGETRTPRQEHHLFFNGMNELAYPVTIQYTKQWLVYENLDPSFSFNWETLK